MDLPAELAIVILSDALASCYRKTALLAPAYLTPRIPMAFSRNGWKQAVRFMLVCKQWEDLVWSLVRDVICGSDYFPSSFAFHNFPKFANQLQRLCIDGIKDNLSELMEL